MIDYKMFLLLSVIVLSSFSLGGITSTLYDDYYPLNEEFAQVQENTKAIEISHPTDRLQTSNVHVYQYQIVIDKLGNYTFETSTFSDSNSMDPLLDNQSQGLQIIPKSIDDLKVGDVISYELGDRIIIHRITRINADEQGWFATVKGDNNEVIDPLKIRFTMIKRVLIGVLY